MKHYATPEMMFLQMMSEDVLTTSTVEQGNEEDIVKKDFSIFEI